MTIYLDHAATSWPKPAAVPEAMTTFLLESGGNPGRGGHSLARNAAAEIDRVRRALAEFLGLPKHERLIFTAGATDSLNIAIKGILRPGDCVFISPMEHNSVLRPLARLARSRSLRVHELPADRHGRILLDPSRELFQSLRPSLACICHVSNVNGFVQPISKLAELCKSSGTRLLVDAAQSAGHLPIHMERLGIDLLAVPGHKGLLGPTGIGLLAVAPGCEPEPLRLGGTGTSSESELPPSTWPARHEAGTLNGLGIAGLGAALPYAKAETQRHEERRDLTAELADELRSIPELTLFSGTDNGVASDVLSLTSASIEPQELAAILDASFDIALRAGLHCAPRAHRHMGTDPRGTLRASLGHSTGRGDVKALAEALREILDVKLR